VLPAKTCSTKSAARDEIRRTGAPGAAPERNARTALTVPQGLSTFAGVSTAWKLL
jgi:hypothetical protein